MKWLTMGIIALLGIVLTVMGGYLYHLQFQIDELHLLLPLDRENALSEAKPPTDLANEAVIENINARIDNLADTLELIANANQRDERSAEGEVDLQPGSEVSQANQGGSGNRVAAVLAGRAEISEINRRLDRLDQSFEEILGTIDRGASVTGDLDDPSDIKAPAKQMDNDLVQSTPVPGNKTNESAGTDAPRVKEAAPKKSTAPVPARSKRPLSEKTRAQAGWSVNLMSLTEMAIAKKEQEKMRKKGVSAEIQPTKVSGRTWYRVRVGGFKTKQEAQKFAESTKKKLGLAGTWVTR
ncbi:MAG: SPOR domain-containing protein [Methylococcaceae bacterium]|nr:SPOR domain-containing protein [Methylococcaceae bacterium]